MGKEQPIQHISFPDRAPRTEAPQVRDRAFYLASPDYIWLAPGHADALIRTSPEMVAGAAERVTEDEHPPIGLNVNLLGKYFLEVEPDNERQETLPAVIDNIKMQLDQFIPPERQIEGLDDYGDATSDAAVRYVSNIKTNLAETYGVYSGQLTATANLLDDADFVAAVDRYREEFKDTPRMKHGVPMEESYAEYVDRRIGGIRQSLVEQPRQIQESLTPDNVTFLQDEGVIMQEPGVGNGQDQV